MATIAHAELIEAMNRAFSDLPPDEFAVLPDGVYPGEVMKADVGVSKNSGNMLITLEFRIKGDGEWSKAKMFLSPLSENTIGRQIARRTLRYLGVTLPWKDTREELEAALRGATAPVKVSSVVKDGRVYQEIKAVHKPPKEEARAKGTTAGPALPDDLIF